MDNDRLTIEVISSVLGVVMSIAFEYFPKLSTWFYSQEKSTKRGILLLAAMIVAIGLQVRQCSLSSSCGSSTEDFLFNLLEFAKNAFIIIITAQATHGWNPLRD